MPDEQLDGSEVEAVQANVRTQAHHRKLRLTQHCQQEMVEEDISLNEVLEAMDGGHIIENYPEHRRGPCCLFSGTTQRARPLHIVCTTSLPTLIIITVYEPKPPKWASATERGS